MADDRGTPSAGTSEPIRALDKTDVIEDQFDNPTVTARPRREPVRPAGSLANGDRVDRYIIEGLLGAGGMGEVYAAYDPELDRRIALKLIRKQHDARRSARLLAEAQALARLSHPNVVAVHDVGAVERGVYIAMEYVDGITLTQWLERGKRTWREIIEVFAAVGRGLEAAHQAGLVHRDVKPDNIVLGNDRRVRIIDFGVAYQAERTRSTGLAPASAPTIDIDEVVGTPAFMAPEQFNGMPVDPAADQFSFAVALYLALWGQKPFPGSSVAEIAASVTGGKLASPPAEPKIPASIRDAILRALATSPTHRHTSMRELVARIQPRSRATWPLIIAGAAAVGAGALAIGFAAGSGGEQCTGFERELTGIWDAQRRATLERAFAGAASWPLVSSTLDRYAVDWAHAKTTVCRAKRSGGHSQALVDQRMTCLDARLRHLDVTVTMLLGAGAVLDEAPRLAVTLPAIGPCENLTFVGSTAAPATADPKQVRAIEDGLARLPLLRWTSRFDEGIRVADETIASATAIGWDSAAARALIGRGMIEYHAGDAKRGRQTLLAAIERATAASDTFAHAQAWVLLVGLSQPSEALQFANLASAEVARAGNDPELVGLLAHERGTALWKLGRLDEALASYRESRPLLERALGARHPLVAMVRGSIGNLLRDLGKPDESVAELESLLAMERELYGDGYPSLGNTLNNLGLGYEQQRRFDLAKAMFAKSLAAYERLGKHHTFLAWPLENLARAERRQGRFEAADEYWQRAYDIQVAALGEQDPAVTALLLVKLLDRMDRGHTSDADALEAQVVARYEAQPSPDRAVALGVSCELMRRRGELDAAAIRCAKALEAAAADGNAPDRTLFLDEIAVLVAVDRHDLPAATDHLHAAELALAKIKIDRRLAEAAVGRARAHVYSLAGKQAESADAARAARSLYVDEGRGFQYYVDELDRLAH